MIEIEFEKSPDSEIVGKYLSYKNNLIFGSSAKQCSLIIDDPAIDSQHIALELSSTGLACHNSELGRFFHVNSKKFSGSKNLKAGDIVTIGETTFKIVNFLFQDQESQKLFQENYQKVMQSMPELTGILEKLENELVKLQVQESKEN